MRDFTVSDVSEELQIDNVNSVRSAFKRLAAECFIESVRRGAWRKRMERSTADLP